MNMGAPRYEHPVTGAIHSNYRHPIIKVEGLSMELIPHHAFGRDMTRCPVCEKVLEGRRACRCYRGMNMKKNVKMTLQDLRTKVYAGKGKKS